MIFQTYSTRVSRVLFTVFTIVALNPRVAAFAQAPAKSAPPPDTLVLTDGETLTGHLIGAQASSVAFASDILGAVTIDWSKVRSLHTSGRYAVTGKGLLVTPSTDITRLPVGSLDATATAITLDPGAGKPKKTIPVADAGQVVEESTLQKQVQRLNFFQAWTGTITGGAALVQATQQSRTFTGAVSLRRAIPTEASFAPRNRTLVDFIGSQGFLQEPGSPRLKTAIYHVELERDQYFSPSRVFAFGAVAYDHNFSQGLVLSQVYSGGIGWTVIKTDNETLDLKGSVNYLRQRFQTAGLDQNLAASTFSEDFMRKFAGGITFIESVSATPTWSDRSAWLARGNSSFNVPVYHRLSFNLAVIDTFLNTPSPGFRKNSFQLTSGLTYALK